MTRLHIFPEIVTDTSDQSRTLGADLSALLAGREIATFVNNRELLLKAMYELWLNLSCLPHRHVDPSVAFDLTNLNFNQNALGVARMRWCQVVCPNLDRGKGRDENGMREVGRRVRHDSSGAALACQNFVSRRAVRG